MKFYKWYLLPLLLVFFANTLANAAIMGDKLTGSTPGTATNTAVFRFDLSNITESAISSITVNTNTTGGDQGVFSGFDLDAILLSYDSTDSAADMGIIVSQNVFDFSPSGTSFTPGPLEGFPPDPFLVPRPLWPSADPDLFGSTSAGEVENSVATLGVFDAIPIADFRSADGFLSMGAGPSGGGSLTFQLTSSLLTSGLYLYLGEVGNNGEEPILDFEFSEPIQPAGPTGFVPEPTTAAIWGVFSLIGICTMRRKRNRGV